MPSASNAYDHAYEDAMKRIEAQGTDREELAKQVLSWIVCAERPLTITELQEALAVEHGETRLDEENFPDAEDMVSVCAGLVTVDRESNVIRLVHYTTQEYFQRTQGRWFPNAEMDITLTLINYCLFDAFKRPCATYEKYEDRLRRNELMTYVSRYWGHHARKLSTFSPELAQSIVRCLEDQLRTRALFEASCYDGPLHMPLLYTLGGKKLTGLHLAALIGADNVTKLLLDSGKIHPDSQDELGTTPLAMATRAGYATIMKRLLNTGKVDPDVQDSEEMTPLKIAIRRNDFAAVELLLGIDKVNPNRTNSWGQTPLHLAVVYGNAAIIKLLLEISKVEPDFTQSDGYTPLLLAVCLGREDVVNLLLRTGKVNVNIMATRKTLQSWFRKDFFWHLELNIYKKKKT